MPSRERIEEVIANYPPPQGIVVFDGSGLGDGGEAKRLAERRPASNASGLTAVFLDVDPEAKIDGYPISDLHLSEGE